MILVCTPAYPLTLNQEVCIKLAYKYGNEISWRGDTFGETVASILYQESKANYKKYQTNGVVVGDFNKRRRAKSLGPMQVQLPAARDVEKAFPRVFNKKFGNISPTKEELIIALLTDIDFNIECGAKYFELRLKSKRNWREAILAYNIGDNGTIDKNDYVRKVLKWRKTIIQPLMKNS